MILKTIQFKHETHKDTALKFIALLGVLGGYFAYMTWLYDSSTGASLTLLSWSFFVVCTPVADGGFILAFPIRLLFGTRMVTTQIFVWFVAVGINIFMLIYNPKTYDITFLTALLKRILTEPYPYWSILIISAIGTFLSIYFGDEMMDVTAHKCCEKYHKHGFTHRVIIVVGLGLVTVLAYYHLLRSLGIEIPE